MKNTMKKPVAIPVEKLRPFAGHPFKVRDDDEMNALIESIQTQGVLSPLIVRPIANTDEYEVVSGHRRLHAAQLLCCDGAAWHKSGGLELPENIVLFHIPPYTPEMNPIEQIWKEIRKRGFRNEVFATLELVVNRLCDTICSLSNNLISSITGRAWIIKTFN